MADQMPSMQQLEKLGLMVVSADVVLTAFEQIPTSTYNRDQSRRVLIEIAQRVHDRQDDGSMPARLAALPVMDDEGLAKMNAPAGLREWYARDRGRGPEGWVGEDNHG